MWASPTTGTASSTRGVELGAIDIAYLNAGVTTGEQDITKVTDEQYRRILSVNVDGMVFGTRAVVPELIARGGGAVVATSSLAGIVAFAGDPMYTLTKHAVVGFVRSVAPWLAEHHITINAICPGLVDTPLIDGRSVTVWPVPGFRSSPPRPWPKPFSVACSGEDTGQAVVVQLGREAVAYRFGRPPGPRAPGVEGKIPPEWLADAGPARIADRRAVGERPGLDPAVRAARRRRARWSRCR